MKVDWIKLGFVAVIAAVSVVAARENSARAEVPTLVEEIFSDQRGGVGAQDVYRVRDTKYHVLCYITQNRYTGNSVTAGISCVQEKP